MVSLLDKLSKPLLVGGLALASFLPFQKTSGQDLSGLAEKVEEGKMEKENNGYTKYGRLGKFLALCEEKFPIKIRLTKYEELEEKIKSRIKKEIWENNNPWYNNCESIPKDWKKYGIEEAIYAEYKPESFNFISQSFNWDFINRLNISFITLSLYKVQNGSAKTFRKEIDKNGNEIEYFQSIPDHVRLSRESDIGITFNITDSMILRVTFLSKQDEVIELDKTTEAQMYRELRSYTNMLKAVINTAEQN